jgi:hypothetical protein
VSRVARSWRASRIVSSKSSRPVCCPSTRSSGAVLQRACRRAQFSLKLSQKPKSPGIPKATWSQWWQTMRKLCEAVDSPPKAPYGMTFQRKMLPSTSGGRVGTSNEEFRTRLSRMMALPCSWVCFSNARVESRFASRSIAVWKTVLGVGE